MSEDAGQNFKLMLVVMVLLSLVIAAGTSYFMLQQLGARQNGNQVNKATAELGPTHEVGKFTVNLSNDRRYLRMNLALEVSNESAIKNLKERKPQIRDAVISIIRTKKSQDINTRDGIKALRKQVRTELNKFIAKGKVTNVFFTEFVVQ